MEEAYRKEQEKLERDNMKMSVPGMIMSWRTYPYDSNCASGMANKQDIIFYLSWFSHSPSDESSHLSLIYHNIYLSI